MMHSFHPKYGRILGRSVQRTLSASASAAPPGPSTEDPSAAFEKGTTLLSNLKVGPMKKLYKYYTPMSINFGGGVPMDAVFPIKRAEMVYQNDKGEETSYSLENSTTLLQNYQRGDGLPKLKEWFHEHTAEVHQRDDKTFSCCASVGSTDAFGKILQLVSTDVVVFDKYAYGTAVSATKAFGKKTLGVETDELGMIPESLEAKVTEARQAGHKVNLVYLIPVAQNPTGVTIPKERLARLYDVCKKLDLLVVEDDAYYYLHFENEVDSEYKLPGLQALPTSLFEMDTDGRVIRFDSLSKFVAPGMRLGWVSGPTDFIDKYQLLQELTSQFPSGVSQSAFLGLVRAWGKEGFNTHLEQIQLHYRYRRDVMASALRAAIEEHGVKCGFVTPTGGMFIWLQINDKRLQGLRSEELFQLLASDGIITVPGKDFYVPLEVCDGASEGSGSEGSSGPLTVRLSYAASSEENMVIGSRVLIGSLSRIARELSNDQSESPYHSGGKIMSESS